MTYQTAAQSPSDLTTYTFSSQAIGTASSNRRVIIGTVGFAGIRTVSSLTVGGISASLVKRQQQGSVTAEIWIATVPTGTTADVVVTWSGGQTRCAIAVWSATGLENNTPVDTDGTNIAIIANSSNVTLTTVDGGFVVGIGIHSNVTALNISCRNMTERNESTLEVATVKVAAADVATSGTSLIVGMDLNNGATGNSNSPYAVASF